MRVGSIAAPDAHMVGQHREKLCPSNDRSLPAVAASWRGSRRARAGESLPYRPSRNNAWAPSSRCANNHVIAFSSIQRCASTFEPKPGMCSRLPLGQATRTYHPIADVSGRASKAGFELGFGTDIDIRASSPCPDVLTSRRGFLSTAAMRQVKPRGVRSM
jgi:hypothetical protein